jgi:predicted phosphoribosyltransferase
MRAAVTALRKEEADRIIIAIPVASPAVCADFVPLVDQIVCVSTPEPFYAVGAWYDDFSQTTDDEVREFLQAAADLTATTTLPETPQLAT